MIVRQKLKGGDMKMRNTFRDLIEEHFLITIFLVSISVIIAFVVTVIGPYTSATYYPE